MKKIWDNFFSRAKLLLASITRMSEISNYIVGQYSEAILLWSPKMDSRVLTSYDRSLNALTEVDEPAEMGVSLETGPIVTDPFSFRLELRPEAVDASTNITLPSLIAGHSLRLLIVTAIFLTLQGPPLK